MPSSLLSQIPTHLRDQINRPMVEVQRAWADRRELSSAERLAMSHLVSTGALSTWRPEHEHEASFVGPGPGLAQVEAHNAAIAAAIAANNPPGTQAQAITTPAAPPPTAPALGGLPADATANGATMNATDWATHKAKLGLF